MSRADAVRAAEQAARTAYGRLVAILASRTRDIAEAEDALGEAFLAALRTWPVRGIPEKPEAWLLQASRNRLSNVARHASVRERFVPELQRRLEGDGEPAEIPDEILRLMFVCAHPAIDPSIRTPLMLQTVIGLDAARISEAFAVPQATMSQRLVRAKVKIRDAGLRFSVPGTDEIAERLDAVLDAIYVAFGSGWASLAGPEDGSGLTDEAIHLGRLMVSLMPHEPEPKGLLALMLYAEARRAARIDDLGRFVPLDRQDARVWNRDMIVEAEALLIDASRTGRFGRFQCEAAIQSVHVQRPLTGATNTRALVTLYGLLIAQAPSLGARIGHAVVVAENAEPVRALDLLDAIEGSSVERHQPYWVARAHVLERLDRNRDSIDCLTRAQLLSADPAVTRHLADWRLRLEGVEAQLKPRG